jgi:two-component system sensor histidine kinase KdpD
MLRLFAVVGVAVFVSVLGALGFRGAGLGVPVQVLTLALGVVAAGMAGRVAGFTSAVLVVGAFNYAFTPPLYTFLVDDPQNYLVFGLLLVTGVVVGSLSDRIRKLAEDQIRQAREAQAARLFRGFSHDLKTPLAVIGGTAASLKTRLRGRVDEEDWGRLSTIETQTGDLGRQVDNLLDLARLSSDKAGWTLALVPAEELLFSCRDRCASWMPARLIEVQTPAEVPLVRVEPSLVEQALLNLVGNADRYSPPGGPVHLTLARDGSWVELRVSDRGPGVPEAEKRVIFEPFVRGSAAGVPGRRGTGLGLAVVSEVVRLHNGTCGVRDRVGGGSEFWLRLPTEGSP